MTSKFLLMTILLTLVFGFTHARDLNEAILDHDKKSDCSKFRITPLKFEINTAGQPKDVFFMKKDYVNTIRHAKNGNILIRLDHLDVTGRFKYCHIPTRTDYKSILNVKSIKGLELILGRTCYKSKTQAEWAYFSIDVKGNYVFEFYIATFDENADEIAGLRYGVATWSNKEDGK
jgi:hypothetical protein